MFCTFVRSTPYIYFSVDEIIYKLEWSYENPSITFSYESTFFLYFFYYIKINPLRIFNPSTQNTEEEGGLVCIFGSGLLRNSQNQLLIQEDRLRISQL